MSAENYASFLRNIGHKTIRTGSCWWYDVSPHVFLSFPFHIPIVPQPGEINSVLGTTNIAARFCCPEGMGRKSYYYVCDDPEYDIEKLGKTRRKVRRGLNNCAVRKLTFQELESRGALKLNRDTLLRQSRDVPADHDAYWRNFYRVAGTYETIETWGAFAGDDLAAYLISFLIEDSANITILRSDRELLKTYPNNALLYEYIKDALSRPGIGKVCYGLEPVKTQLETMDYFKKAMGFDKRPIGQRIEFNRILKPLLIEPFLKMMLSFTERRPERERFNKFSGMVRWFLEQPRMRMISGK